MSDSDLFRQNRERWGIFQFHKAKTVSKLTPEHIFLHTNANGTLNLRMGDQLFHSEDPVEEARRCFEKLNLHGIQLIVVFGVGLGYFYDQAKAWLREDEGRFLVFLEDHLEVIYHLLHTERGGEIVGDKQVRLMAIDKTALEDLATTFVLKPFTVTAIDFYAKTRESHLVLLRARIGFLMQFKGFTALEYSNQGRGFFINYFSNMLQLPTASLANRLFGHFSGVPAIICGAGPSLEKNRELLATLRNRALIFAGGTAMNAVNAIGLLPILGSASTPILRNIRVLS